MFEGKKIVFAVRTEYQKETALEKYSILRATSFILMIFNSKLEYLKQFERNGFYLTL